MEEEPNGEAARSQSEPSTTSTSTGRRAAARSADCGDASPRRQTLARIPNRDLSVPTLAERGEHKVRIPLFANVPSSLFPEMVSLRFVPSFTHFTLVNEGIPYQTEYIHGMRRIQERHIRVMSLSERGRGPSVSLGTTGWQQNVAIDFEPSAAPVEELFPEEANSLLTSLH